MTSCRGAAGCCTSAATILAGASEHMRRACASLRALRRDFPNKEHALGRVRHALRHALRQLYTPLEARTHLP